MESFDFFIRHIAKAKTVSSNSMKDRYKSNLFYSGKENAPDYLNVQEITDDVFSTTELCICTLAMDFPLGTSMKNRKELENTWINLLPRLT